MAKHNTVNDTIYSIIRRISGRGGKICLNTRILHDLELSGDDAYECLEKISEIYKIDWTGFDFNEYFPNEGEDTFLRLGKLFGFKYGKYKEMMVQDLVDAAKAGSWLER